jgi:hypothetical protein
MKTPFWILKLDAYGRALLDEGPPTSGFEVSVRLTSPGHDSLKQVAESGLLVHSQVGEIVSGHVESPEALQRLGSLDCVAEIQVSRRLFGESDNRDSRE